MTARTKIENLTTAWISFIIVTGLSSFLINGFGAVSIIGVVGSLAINVVLATLIGRSLLKGSNGTRIFCLVLNALGVVLGSLGVATLGWALLHHFSWMYLYIIAITVAHVVMNARSWRVLRDQAVRSHCR